MDSYEDIETKTDYTSAEVFDNDSTHSSISSLELVWDSANDDDFIILMTNDKSEDAADNEDSDDDTIIYQEKVDTDPVEILRATMLTLLNDSDLP